MRRIVLAGIAALIVSLAATSSAAAATWSIVPVATAPAGAQSSTLGSVSCASLSACTAIGSYTDAQGNEQMVADQWNGSTFSVRELPSPPDISDDDLVSVSCPTANACMAVGNIGVGTDDEVPYAEGWTGSSWVLIPVPLPLGASSGDVASVSCASITDCVAVGGVGWAALVEKWDGAGWTAQPLLPLGSNLEGVSCPTTSSCDAVGTGLTPNTYGVATIPSLGPFPYVTAALIEQLNDGAWTPDQLTLGPAEATDVLQGVSCPAPGACVAGGDATNTTSDPYDDVTGPLAEIGGGTNWSAVSLPGGLYDPRFVSCPAVTSCTVTGYPGQGSVSSLVVVQGSPSGLTVDTTPTLPNGDIGSPDGISCPAVSACVLVGEQEPGFDGPTSGLIEVSAPAASPLAKTLAAR